MRLPWTSWVLTSLTGLCFTQPILSQEVELRDFSVDRFSRNAVVSFFQRCYRASEGFEQRYGATVNLSGNTAPTPSVAFNQDVERRVNFYRALVGMSSDIDFTDREVFRENGDAFVPPAGLTRRRACMEMAFVMTKNLDSVTHDLPTSVQAFTPGAWNAAKNSNLTSGFYGPRAIDNYIGEPGEVTDPIFGKDIGHRRWLLFSRIAEMATGDMPPVVINGGAAIRAPSNALYTIGSFKEQQPSQFVAWPNDGYFPFAKSPTFWSLSYGGADFSNATITVSGDFGSKTIPKSSSHLDFTVEELPPGGAAVFGDSTIVFEPNPADIFISPDEDTTYTVTVSGIEGAGPPSYSYDVTFMNPDRLNEIMNLTGSTTPPLEGANYAFAPVPEAESYELEVSVQEPATWVEDVEAAPELLEINPPLANPSLAFSSLRTASGSKSIRLSFPTPDGGTVFNFQSVVLTRFIVPGAGAMVKFKMFRDFVFKEDKVFLEVTTDGGANWTPIWDIEGTTSRSGNLDIIETEFAEYEASLAGFEGQTVNIRFNMKKSDLSQSQSSFLTYDTNAGSRFTGVFIDDISVTNSLSPGQREIVSMPASSQFATLDASIFDEPLVAGRAYDLRARAVLGGNRFGWGSKLSVTPQNSGLSGWQAYTTFIAPGVTDFTADDDGDGLANGLEFVLGKNALDSSDNVTQEMAALEGDLLSAFFPISDGIPTGVTLEGEFSTNGINWSPTGIPITMQDGMLKISVAVDQAAVKLLRWTARLN